MKRLTILTIVAVSIVLIAPPTHADDERKLRGFVAGKATISTLRESGLQLLSAAGISKAGTAKICQGPGSDNLDQDAEEFEMIAGDLGFSLYEQNRDSDSVEYTFSKQAKHNDIVNSISALCCAVTRCDPIVSPQEDM
jgi:hypothetical protein